MKHPEIEQAMCEAVQTLARDGRHSDADRVLHAIELFRALPSVPTEELSPSVRRLLLDLYEARMNDTAEVTNERLKLISDLLGIEAFACAHPYQQCSRWCGVEARCTVAFKTNPSPQRRSLDCQSGLADVCKAAKADGIVCPAESCDIDDGIRREGLPQRDR